MVSMSVTPSNSTVLGVGDIIPVQYVAYGTFVHPAGTRDITNEVTWSSSVPMIATVASTGIVTPAGYACGVTTITATAGKSVIGTGSDSGVMSATSTFTVADPNIKGCPTQ
jgi:hypothetical protein